MTGTYRFSEYRMNALALRLHSSVYRSYRMIGRGGTGRATTLNPALAKVEAYPVLELLGVLSASSGYASTAGAFARFAAFKAAAINAEVTPFLR